MGKDWRFVGEISRSYPHIPPHSHIASHIIFTDNRFQYDQKAKKSVHKFIRESKQGKDNKKGKGGNGKGGNKGGKETGREWGSAEEAKVVRCPGGEGVGFHISVGGATKNRVLSSLF